MHAGQPSPASPSGATPPGGAQEIVRALYALRRRVLAQLLITRGGLLIAGVVLAGFVFGVIDYVLRWPSSVRMIFWTLNVALLAWLLWKFVVPVLRFRPTITQLALRLEASELGQSRGWQGVLTSGIELANQRPAGGVEGPDPRLARLAAERAHDRFLLHKRDLPRALHAGRAWASLACVGLAGGLLLAMLVARQELTRIGISRVLTPWTSAQWPKRTEVDYTLGPEAHPLGVALPIEGVLTRWSGSVQRVNVEARYRVVVDGEAGPAARVLLTPQSRSVVGSRGDSGELFERLIDTQSLVGSREDLADRTIELVYTIRTEDDETPERTIRLVEPPKVEAIRVEVTPPSYLARVLASIAEESASNAGVLRGSIDAGTGLDDRARVGPILSGSDVEVRITLNKDMPVGRRGQGTPAWLERALPGLAATPGVATQVQPRVWTIRVAALGESVATRVQLVDEFGVAARDEASLRLEVAEDRDATAAVIDPPQDETVLATAVVEAVGEGRDDVALERVTLRSQVAKGDPASPGAIPQLEGEPREVASASAVGAETATPTKTLAKDLRASATIELAALGVVAGDEVHLTATALDARGAAALAASDPQNAGNAVQVSAIRRLRVISESQFVEQVRAQLAGVRETAKRLEGDQRELSGQRDAALQDAATAQQQAQQQQTLRTQMTPLAATLAQVQRRLERNRLEDAATRGVLEDAQDAAARAAEAAENAAQELARAGEASDAARRDAIEQAQNAAERALAELVDALAQGDDDWTVRRSLEQLLTQQRQVRAQTQAAGAQTQGKTNEQLTQAQREDLERIARRQSELSQQASATIEQLEQRAKALQESNPQQASAMEQAAARARAKQLTQRQRAASEQVRQNQTGQAQENQQAAEDALEEALESLEESKQQQEQQLRRVLADLMQSLRQLIERQEQELARLAPALAGKPVDALDAGMMSLHQNTLGVLEKARKEAAKAEVLVGALDAAAQAMGAAVVALRSEPPDYPQSDAMERQSLAKLKEALAEGERLEQEAQDKDEQRVRRELQKAYAESLELQAALKAQSDPLVGAEETRRTRSVARGLATKQEELRQKLGELRSKTTDFSDAKVFDFAHTRLDSAMGGAAKTLGEGRADKGTQRQQATAMRVLASLVEALKEAEKNDQLQDAQGGGGSGSQSGQQAGAIPPMAELILLRGMQAEAADRTRAASDEGAAGDAAELADIATLQDQLAQQAQALVEKLQQSSGGAPQGEGP